jgi:hypothetical protein
MLNRYCPATQPGGQTSRCASDGSVANFRLESLRQGFAEPQGVDKFLIWIPLARVACHKPIASFDRCSMSVPGTLLMALSVRPSIHVGEHALSRTSCRFVGVRHGVGRRRRGRRLRLVVSFQVL